MVYIQADQDVYCTLTDDRISQMAAAVFHGGRPSECKKSGLSDRLCSKGARC